MPNPFQSLNLIPIMPTVLDVMQRQANVERINAGTNYTNAETQLMQQRLQDEKLIQQSLMAVNIPKQDAGTPADDNDIIGQMQRQVSSMQQQSQVLDTLAKTPGLSPERSMQYMNESNALKKTMAATQMDLLKEKSALYEKLGDAAAGNKTQQDVDLAQARFHDLDPRIEKTLPVDRMPSGQWVATPKTISVLNSFGDHSMSQAKRASLALQQQSELDRKAKAEADLEQRKQEAADRNARAAAAQAGIDEARKQREQAHADVVDQRIYSQAQTISNEYKTDDQVKEFANHKKMYTTAYTYVFDKDGKVKPEGPPGTPEWNNHDSASDFELSKQFIAMVHPHYRGTTYDAKELRSLANLPEHLANAIAGVASGKVLAQSDRVNMVNAMKRVIASENDDQIQREDKALQRVSNLTRGVKGATIQLNPEDYVTKYAFRPNKEQGTKPDEEKLTATNPQTKQRIISRDGGRTWQPLNE